MRIGLGLNGYRKNPGAVALITIFNTETGVASAELGARGVAVVCRRGHLCAQGSRVEGVNNASCVSIARKCGLAGRWARGSCAGRCWWILVLVDIQALACTAQCLEITRTKERTIAFRFRSAASIEFGTAILCTSVLIHAWTLRRVTYGIQLQLLDQRRRILYSTWHTSGRSCRRSAYLSLLVRGLVSPRYSIRSIRTHR